MTCSGKFQCFNHLPVVAVVNEKIFCCHGGNPWSFECSEIEKENSFQGLSPELDGLDQIRQIQRPTDVPDSGESCNSEERLRQSPFWPIQVFSVICYGLIQMKRWLTGARMMWPSSPSLVAMFSLRYLRHIRRKKSGLHNCRIFVVVYGEASLRTVLPSTRSESSNTILTIPLDFSTGRRERLQVLLGSDISHSFLCSQLSRPNGE